MEAAVYAGVGMDHLADLEHLLESAEIAVELLRGLLAEQLRDSRADGSSRGVVL
jgi:hypothetical protein